MAATFIPAVVDFVPRRWHRTIAIGFRADLRQACILTTADNECLILVCRIQLICKFFCLTGGSYEQLGAAYVVFEPFHVDFLHIAETIRLKLTTRTICCDKRPCQ